MMTLSIQRLSTIRCVLPLLPLFRRCLLSLLQCGADFVKTNQRAPPSSKAHPLERWCSLDGDADRLIYYYLDETSTFKLLDGDRIATLAASFLADLTRTAGMPFHPFITPHPHSPSSRPHSTPL